MAKSERIYQRTEAGETALRQRASALSVRQHQVLEALRGVMGSKEIRAALPRHFAPTLARTLVELEALGFVESVSLQWLCDLEAVGYIRQGPSSQFSSRTRH